ncbi:9451_t:CDS:2 [Entrophospora sp. SA101]|nr:9451_t:CDS:2 [Entrophospora sp. SA101]
MVEPILSTFKNFMPFEIENKTFAQHVQTLQKIEPPKTAIYHALSTDLPIPNLLEVFQNSAKKIDNWLEYANVTILALDFDIKEGINVKNVNEMDLLILQYASNIDLLQELLQSTLSKLNSDDDQNYKDIKATFDRINSDWLEVKTFFAKIKKEISVSKQRRELLDKMDQILTSIEELNTNIFEFQEQRHSGGFGDNNNNSDLFPFPRLSSNPNGILEKKFNTLNKKWESLKNEMTSIREELKEDKWSGLFKQVAGNANQMMDSLERSVKQCKDFMYRAINRSDSPRYPQRNNNQRSYSSDSLHHLQQQNNIQPQVAINPKNYQRLYKNFDAKRKYYVPAVTKLLTMLANGINNQMTQDPESIDKYNAMKERWDNILDGVADVQRDMPTLEYMLDASLTSSTSPPSSIPSSIASSPPISPNMRPTVRSSRFSPELLPNSPSRNYRSVSPYRTVISPSEYDRSLSPPTTSPSIASHSYLTPNGHRPVSYGNISHHGNNNNYHGGGGSNYHGNNYHRALSPQPRNGRSKSSHRSESPPPMRPNSTRPVTPDRSYASAIPRPVTSMGLDHRSQSRTGMRSILPKASTPQPGMTSTMSRLGMVSPPLPPITPTSRRNPIRSPTPSSVTSSTSRPITPETYDDYHHNNGGGSRAMTPLTDILSKMSMFSTEVPSKYIPLKSDPLDVEVAKVVNSSPLTVKVERVSTGGGKYYFGNETLGRDRKVHLCKLVNFASGRNKVMVRVGGGWKDLDMFLLDHSLTNVGI